MPGKNFDPEGPFERGEIRADWASAYREESHLVDFVEEFDAEVATLLGTAWRRQSLAMVLFLMRSHIQGRIVTVTSLIAASGLSYGSSMRAIEALEGEGLILRRERTRTGRSFSLHPSEELMRRWGRFSRWLQDMVGTFASLPATPIDAAVPPGGARQIGPPKVLEQRLGLSGSLRLLLHADPTVTAMHSVKRQLELVLGVAISSRALSIDRLKMQIEENARLASSRFDIIACDLPWFGELAASEALLPLDSLIAQEPEDEGDFHPDAILSSSYLGRRYGIPIVTTAEMLVYRQDILDAAGIAPPDTTRNLLVALERLRGAGNTKAGISWNAGRGTPIGHSFMMMLSAFGQPIFDLPRKGNGFDASVSEGWRAVPLLGTDAARETAEYMVELLDHSPPGILSMAWYERAAAFARGDVAFAYSHSLLAPLFELNANCAAYRKTGYLPHPTGPRGRPITPLGGYALAIPANLEPSRIRGAWRAIKVLTSPEVTKLFTRSGNLACSRRSVARDPEVWAKSPMIAAVERFADSGWMQMWPRPPVPSLSRAVAILGEEIHDLMLGQRSVREALDLAQRRLEVELAAPP